MGWLISIVMLVIGCYSHNDILVITSGLYAIGGSVGAGLQNIADKNNAPKVEN